MTCNTGYRGHFIFSIFLLYFFLVNSEGAYSLLNDGKQAIGSDNMSGQLPIPLGKCCDGYNVTTYGTASSNEWHASSIRPNIKGGSDFTLVGKDGLYLASDSYFVLLIANFGFVCFGMTPESCCCVLVFSSGKMAY